MEEYSLKGKKVLITQSALHFFAGSEITTMELATFFKQKGADVLVFTWCYEEPMKNEFIKRGIEVTTDEDDIRLIKFNILWVHHETIPKKVLEVLQNKPANIKVFFYHMSPLEILPIEHPYLYELEKKLADKILFTSEGTKDSLLELYPSIEKNSSILENLVPPEYIHSEYLPRSLKNILVVSNHPPAEILAAQKILQGKKYNVDFMGQSGKVKLISLAQLSNYDLIITIGKTVPYCLCANIPVYIYDHFGGPGYLTGSNFDKARYRTFSGRGFATKPPEQIVAEIETSYTNAVSFQTRNLTMFRGIFSIENNLTKLLNTTRKKEAKLSPEELNSYREIISLVMAKITSENEMLNLRKEVKDLRQEINTIKNSKKYKTLAKIDNAIHLRHLKLFKIKRPKSK